MTTRDDNRDRSALRLMIAWLTHPVTVLGILLLVVNDHLLKSAHPGLVTGKLSDFAGLLVVGEANAYLQVRREANAYRQVQGPETWTVSTDGQDWRSMTDTEEADFEQALPALTTTAGRSCVPSEPTHCYRIVRGHLRVEESTDGGATWTVSWEIPDSRRGYLARSYPELDDVETYLSSHVLAVHPVPGGHIAAVANGRDGIALRDTAGSWTRISSYGGDSAPLDARPSVLITETIIAILVSLLAMAVLGWRFARRGAGRITLSIMFGLGGGVAILCGLGPWDGRPTAIVAVVMVAVGLCVALVSTIGLLATSPWRVVGRRKLPIVGLIGLITALGWWAPYIAWARGWTTYTGALLLGLAAVSAGLLLAHRIDHPVEPSPPTEPT